MTIPEAVKAVPHREFCGAHSHSCDCDGGPLRCDCDRDERIAKGIEAMLVEADRWLAADAPLKAFVEASNIA